MRRRGPTAYAIGSVIPLLLVRGEGVGEESSCTAHSRQSLTSILPLCEREKRSLTKPLFIGLLFLNQSID